MSQKKQTIKELMEQFDKIAEEITQGDLEIEEVLKKYQQGEKISAEIKNQLEKAKLEIEIINQKEKKL